MRAILVAAALSLFCATAPLLADNIQTLSEFNGNQEYFDPGPYQPPTVIGTFNILAGDTAITISGTFGNSVSGSSAGVDLYLGNLLVAQCVEDYLCFLTGPTDWSDTLTANQIASLGTGTVNLTAVQTSEYITRLGATTLDQTTANTAITPEPSTVSLLGTGLIGALSFTRRRLTRSAA